ncbi:MAG TPA: MnhB domain-containing protein [Noviherbaspirillum sp.]|uniref:MnhB domain-containing protein n=1 Tax=Noviherbaspirillum sp. TaxID=1926288 RepID=UPI002D253631|nr:MnhB domain-containing protein [Noviherbaspirillum sp.]HYD96250.1 MnhB domain-containing protein [Noviherbaspirillum sp.]
MKLLPRLGVTAVFAVLAAVLVHAVLNLPEPAVRLGGAVDKALGQSGVSHPVTAVLLNFRGYDTLLETAVLLLALIGVLTASGQVPGSMRRLPSTPHAFLQSLARLVSPLMVLAAGYLLWAGSHRPGGAFQAAAVLAAGIILLYLAGLLPANAASTSSLRAGLLAGFLIFLALAAAPLRNGALLQYPVEMAGALILLIESGLTLSLALTLAGLFLCLPDEFEEEDD